MTTDSAHYTISHLLYTFPFVGLPQEIKTDNTPFYTNICYRKIFHVWNNNHGTRIPYNLQGEAIVEHHQLLKQQICNIKSRYMHPPKSPYTMVHLSILTLTFSLERIMHLLPKGILP